MKEIRNIISVIMAFGFFQGHAQELVDSIRPIIIVNTPDTIVRQDTIIIKEVITRTDVIYRTEKVVRVEEKLVGSYENTVPGTAVLNATEMKNGELVQDYVYHKEVTDTVAESVNVETFSSADNGTLKSEDLPNISLPASSVVEIIELPKTVTSEIDLNEMVTFRGDTIPMVLKDRNLGRFDRGLFNFLFVPKGIWQVGLTASYGEFSTADLEILDLISDIDFNGKIFSVKPYFSYFFKSNLSVGLRLGFTQGRANVGSFNVDFDEDMSFNLHDIMYKNASYSAAVTFSQYLGISRKGRFGVFNEVELSLAGGNSDFHRPFNGEMRQTHTNTFQVALNFSPGVSVYIIDPISFNVSLGVFGLYLKHEKQKVNGEELGKRTTSGANFRFNIFNINFGIAVNI